MDDNPSTNPSTFINRCSQNPPKLHPLTLSYNKKKKMDTKTAQDQPHANRNSPPPSSSSPPVTTQFQQVIMLDQKDKTSKGYMCLLVANYLFLFVGSVSSSLLSKFYFVHKGSSRWVSTWVQCAGFPLLLLPIFLPYHLFKSTDRPPFSGFTPKTVVLSILVGLMLGVNNLLFSWSNSYLPVSTVSLVLSSQLAFTLILSFIIVKQKITFQNLNCVIILTLSSVNLALSSSDDRPPGLTPFKYFIGFCTTLGAGLLFALYLPVVQRIYRKVYCYAMVMEMQLVMEIAATTVATAGMALDGGFSHVKKESQAFDKGPVGYWATVVSNVVTWQMCFMGTAGIVFLTSSLTGGICSTVLLTMNVVGGALVYGDPFGGFKVVSTLLCVWGFCSYVYGMYVKAKTANKQEKEEGRDQKRTDDDEHQNRRMEMANYVQQQVA